MSVALRWWRARTLRARLSLLVTGAVAVAVLTLAVLAFGAVAEIQQHQLQAELTADAQAIAEQPDRWRAGDGTLPNPDAGGQFDDDHHHPRDLGARWQVLDSSGTVVSAATNPLPVTAAAREVAGGGRRTAQESVTIGSDSYLMMTLPARGGGAVQ